MQKKKRVLYIGIENKYLNATMSYIPTMLAAYQDAIFYGPGYVSDAVLAQGIERFVDKTGNVDVVIAPTHLCLKTDPIEAAKFYRNVTLHYWDMSCLADFLANAREFLSKITLPKIGMLMDLDTYASKQENLDAIAATVDYFTAWGPGFFPLSIDELKVFNKEAFYHRKKATREFGLWTGFVEQQKHRWINMGHFVAESEFFWGDLSHRPYDIFVPGQPYYRRKDAADKLNASARYTTPSVLYKKFFSALDRIGAKPYSHYILHHLYNLIFIHKIKQSRIAVTDGSGYDEPIRKFFEIPACGSLMLCWPCTGLESLGFSDGESAVFIDDAHFLEQVDSLLNDHENTQRIAEQGRSIVFANHSLAARALQFHHTLESILSGRFRGSIWKNGSFEIITE